MSFNSGPPVSLSWLRLPIVSLFSPGLSLLSKYIIFTFRTCEVHVIFWLFLSGCRNLILSLYLSPLLLSSSSPSSSLLCPPFPSSVYYSPHYSQPSITYHPADLIQSPPRPASSSSLPSVLCPLLYYFKIRLPLLVEEVRQKEGSKV